jgi:hypothetical protein
VLTTKAAILIRSGVTLSSTQLTSKISFCHQPLTTGCHLNSFMVNCQMSHTYICLAASPMLTSQMTIATNMSLSQDGVSYWDMSRMLDIFYGIQQHDVVNKLG